MLNSRLNSNSSAQNVLTLKDLPAAILKNVMLPKKTSYNFILRHDDFLRCKTKSSRLWYALARGGVKKADVTYTSSGEFTIKNIIWWGCPMYPVKNESEIVASVQKAKKKNAPEFGLLLEKEFYEQCQKNPSIRDRALREGGLLSYGSYTENNAAYCCYQCKYQDFDIVRNENDIIAAVQRAKSKNASELNILLEKTYYEQCRKDPSIRERALLKGGLSSFESYTESNGLYCYHKCKYKDFYVVEGALNEASAVKVLNAGLSGAEAVAFFPDAASWNLTLRNKEYLGEWGGKAGLLGAYSQRIEMKAYIFGADGDAFYPAVRILSACKKKTENKLPPKYKKTLDEARNLLEDVNDSDNLEMFIKIHDLICKKVIYDKKAVDCNSCVGALLNSKAKCDGYSDTFYLLCGLKNLPAAYQSGKSKIERKYTEEDNHMWNLFLLDGVWRGTDTTWDGGGDVNEKTVYDYFNIGLDRMKPSYAFSDFMLPKNMLEKTQAYERPTREVQVSSEDEMIKVFRGMIISGLDKITLRCPERFYNTFLRDDGLLWRCLARVGIEKCDCNHRNNVIRISKLVLFSHWAYCEKAEDVSKAAENILANNVQKFTFVFEPKLFQQSFSAKTKFTKLRYLLASGGLECQRNLYIIWN